jgi:hypothetical protein
VEKKNAKGADREEDLNAKGARSRRRGLNAGGREEDSTPLRAAEEEKQVHH